MGSTFSLLFIFSQHRYRYQPHFCFCSHLPIARRGTAQHLHSAQTTLLLDDSPLKAQLQSYNHVCIREYGAELRARDLGVRAREGECGGRGTGILDMGRERGGGMELGMGREREGRGRGRERRKRKLDSGGGGWG